MSSNFEGFLYKFSPLDRCLCPLFKKQRRPSVPVKLCTVKVNIFFIILFSLFVRFRSLICISVLMFSNVGVWMFLNK